MMVSHGWWQTKDGCEESLSCALWAGHAATAVVVSNKCWLRPLVGAHDGVASSRTRAPANQRAGTSLRLGAGRGGAALGLLGQT